MKFILNQPPHNLKKSAYKIADEKVDLLVGEGKFDEALNLLNEMKQTTPHRNADNYDYRIWIFNKLNQYDNKMTELLEAAENNVFFPMADEGYHRGIKQHASFTKLSHQSQQKLDKLRVNVESELKLYMPTTRFNGEILLILHGNGQFNESIAELWPASPYLDKGFAVAYLQSAQLFCTDGYYWTDHYPQNRKAIKQAFGLIKQHAKIEQSAITLAGFSGGAMVSISAVTHGIIEPKQVLAFLPQRNDYVGNVSCQNIAMTIFKAEFDANIDALYAALKPISNTRKFLLKGLGHELPDNMASYVLPYLQQPNQMHDAKTQTND